MKNIVKKLFSSLLILSICFVSMGNSLAFAADSETVATKSLVSVQDESAIVVDMNEIDITKPYEITKETINSRGETVTLKAVYTPAKPSIIPMWSHEYTASSGTWRSYYDGSIISGMSYEYDVSKYGTHWKISNARNLLAHAVLSTIRDKSLTINRSISAPSYPAEVMGVCTVDFIDTPIGHVVSMDAWIKTTISDGGTLTISGN